MNMETDAKQDQWPEKSRKQGRADCPDASGMCEVVVRTRDKGADNDVDEREDAAAVHARL